MEIIEDMHKNYVIVKLTRKEFNQINLTGKIKK